MMKFLLKSCFSVNKLTQMCQINSGEKFKQLVYIDIVLRSIEKLRNNEKDLELMSAKHFYLIPDCYEVCSYQELQEKLPLLREAELKHIMEQNAFEILKQNNDSLSKFLNTVIIISKSCKMPDFESILEQQINIMKDVAKDYKQCNQFSTISLIRFCKSMNYFLKNSENYSLKFHYQSLAFQIMLNKPQIQLKQLYSLMHYLQFVKYNQLVAYLEYKQQAEQISKYIFQRFQQQIGKDLEIAKNPEVYSQFITFFIKANYFPIEYAQFMETNFLERANYLGNDEKRIAYHKVIFCKLNKVGLGGKLLDKILFTQVNHQSTPQFLAYYLLNLLQYQIRLIMSKFVLNPTREYLELLQSEEFSIALIIESTINQILTNFQENNNYHISQDSKNQLIQCNSLLGYFKNHKLDTIPFIKENVKYDSQTRLNEINIDLENFLVSKNIKFLREHQEALNVFDYWIPSLNLVIECDGYFHFVQQSIDRKFSATLTRDFSILNQNHKLISINWFKQHQSRFQQNSAHYIEQLWEKIQSDPKIIYAE